MRLISADSHITVRHDDVKAHLATKYHADYDAAVDRFENRHANLQMPDGSKQLRQYKNPAWGRPGAWDPKERIADMDIDGVDVEVMYSDVSAFRYLYNMRAGAAEATRAFNDVLDDFASHDRRRLIVSYQIPIDNIDDALREVERVAARGGKSLQMPVFPTELGLPDYHDKRYEPLWATIQATGLPVCCHIGVKLSYEELRHRDPTPQHGIANLVIPMTSAEALGMLIMGGVFERFPDLNFVFVESGIGWVAWWLYMIDDSVQRQGYEYPAISELPSHYFRKNVSLTFIEEIDSLKSQTIRDRIGVENMMWSSDYPHPVSSWPESRTIATRQFEGLSEHDRDLMVSGNAERVWRLDPE